MMLLWDCADVVPSEGCALPREGPLLNGGAISRDRRVGTLGVVLRQGEELFFATAFHTVLDPDDGGSLELWCRHPTMAPDWETTHRIGIRENGAAGRATDVQLLPVTVSAKNEVGAQKVSAELGTLERGDLLRFRGCRGIEWRCECEGPYSEAVFGAALPRDALGAVDPGVMSVVRFGAGFDPWLFPGDSGVSIWKTNKTTGEAQCVAQLVGVSRTRAYGLVVRLREALARLGIDQPVVAT